jgi:hypothetical protein
MLCNLLVGCYWMVSSAICAKRKCALFGQWSLFQHGWFCTSAWYTPSKQVCPKVLIVEIGFIQKDLVNHTPYYNIENLDRFRGCLGLLSCGLVFGIHDPWTLYKNGSNLDRLVSFDQCYHIPIECNVKKKQQSRSASHLIIVLL